MAVDHLIEDLTALAARVAKRRRLARLTRPGLAQEAGVPPDVVTRIENARVVSDADVYAVLGILQRHAPVGEPAPRQWGTS